MKKSLIWRTVLVSIVVAWAAYTLYPLTSVDLLKHFDSKARNKDEAYANFWQKVISRTNEVPNAYLNLRGTAREAGISLTNYFKGNKYWRADIKDPNQAVLTVLQREAQGKIKLGLDLVGGNSYLVELDMTNVDPASRSQAVTEATKVLRKRLDQYGVAEPILQPVADNRVLIQMPGLAEADKDDVRRTLQRTAYLEFRLVHADSDDLVKRMNEPGFRVPPGYEKMEAKERKEGGEPDILFVYKKTEMTGKAVKAAFVAFDTMSNVPYVSLAFTSEGADQFGKLTAAHIHERLAILLDGEVYSAPVIQSAIMGGTAQITGRFDLEEARELANVLENPLESPVKIVEERSVSASLGKDAIESGVRACVVGLILSFGLIAIYYRLAGVIANLALLLNIVLLLAVMVTFGATMTLPGIAGIALSIAMGVDANVLIYERIREELLAGKRLAAAVVAGYRKAFGTIFDSHVTTLITSVILIFLGTGPVKGFGVTLTIGICISLFTALLCTRVVFDYLLGAERIKTVSMQRWIKTTNINFLGLRIWGFALAAVVIVAGIISISVRGKDVLGVDFAGGDSVTMEFVKRVDVEDLRKTLEQAGLRDLFIQYQRDALGTKEFLNVTSAYDTGPIVTNTLASAFAEANFRPVALDKVQPTIGKEIMINAGWAIFWSLVAILFYVALRFEFQFAVGAVIAIIITVLMTVACFCLAGRQFTATFVAAILTIVGYSINDTIVVFDRVREYLRLGAHGTLAEIMNRALNATLSRTLLTGGTTFLAALSLFILGGGAINDFAFCFLVGMVTGTFASIFIASPIVLWWSRGKKIEVGVKPKPPEDEKKE